MSVILKRSEKHMPAECGWGCCGWLHEQSSGRNVDAVRRMVKRSERQDWKREAREERDQ